MKGVLIFLAIAVCAVATTVAQPTEVVATTGMVADLVQRVGGERIIVRPMIAPGLDPHLYKPTRDDVARLLKAKAVFSNGLGLEGRMEDALRKLSLRGTPVVSLGEAIPADKLLHEETAPDPHVWMSPSTWALALPAVAEALGRIDPAGLDVFESNSKKAAGEFVDLEERMKSRAEAIPASQRVLVTSHDAFGYFGRATGIEVVGIQGVNTEAEAGVADMNRIVDLMVARRVPAIFFESTLTEKNVRAVIEGCESRGHKVRVGGVLYADSLGAPGSGAETWQGMLEHNMATIEKGLETQK
jgi:manganese/zinc/iron transport system substrate-binding protein